MTEEKSEETKTGKFISRFFVFAGMAKHKMLWRAKKKMGFSLFFSLKLPLSGGETCDIMFPNSEFGRGKE